MLEPRKLEVDRDGNIIFPNYISDELIILKK